MSVDENKAIFRRYVDQLGMMRQLGVIPSPEQAAG
jgi:hypothetical protein